MAQSNKQIGYRSCIKIFGIPVLPPLITQERKEELNKDKQKAIEIEKRLKGKRNSIDSGVMTGSYIEHFRNLELNDESCLNQPSNQDLTLNGYMENEVPLASCNAVKYVANDSFLKSALEDPEFREFFSSTAEKIFKDNKIENVIDLNSDNDSNFNKKIENVIDLTGSNNDVNFNKLKHVSRKESEIQSVDKLSESSSFVRPPESLDLSFSDSLSRVPSVVVSDLSLKSAKSTVVLHESAEEAEKEPVPRVRRNSYTLDSPSPMLLEHLAKEPEKWQSLSDKKEKPKGPGFKTFPGKSQRKHWNKKVCNLSSTFRVESRPTKHTLVRSNTFVKPERKVGESIYSLPCSSRTSPLQFCSFTRSADCIKSMVVNTYELNRGQKHDFNRSPKSQCESVGKNDLQVPSKDIASCEAVSCETIIVQNFSDIRSVSTETSPTSLANNASFSVKSAYSTENCSPPQVEFGDSASQISVATLSTYLLQSVCSGANNENVPININQEDFDDIASLCSSMSISRYLQPSDASRPSTAGDGSEANIRLLKMKHENELKELLEKQRKEEELYSQLLSTSGSVTSRTTTNMSIGDPSDLNFEVMDKRETCSRELFPLQKTSPDGIHSKRQDKYSEREKEAATKLVACAKGYLTRRLLKTEKVQRLIELIRESLACAFSLQSEPYLKPTDLDLHARLAQQLTEALRELQAVVSAPAAARMAVIAADRERLRRPTSRPSSAISTATRKSILRRQQSLTSSEKKTHQSRARTKSFSSNGNTGSVSGSVSSGSRVRSDSASTVSTSSSRLPWR